MHLMSDIKHQYIKTIQKNINMCKYLVIKNVCTSKFIGKTAERF